MSYHRKKLILIFLSVATLVVHVASELLGVSVPSRFPVPCGQDLPPGGGMGNGLSKPDRVGWEFIPFDFSDLRRSGSYPKLSTPSSLGESGEPL